MKTPVCVLLATVALAASVSAGPRLVLDTVVTDLDTRGKEKVVGRFHVITRNGEEIVLPFGDQRYAVVPTLRDNGTVDLSQTMTHPNYKGNDIKLGPEEQNTPLGETNNISYGLITCSTKVSLAK